MSEDKINKIAGLFVVVALHGTLFYAAMSYKLIPPPQEAVTLFVDLINPPPPKKEEPPPEPLKPPPQKVKLVTPRSIELPKPASILVAEAPVITGAEPVAPPPESLIEAPSTPEPVAPPSPPAPVLMASELSLGCEKRTPPNYPTASRRAGEQGRVVLQVELDKTGRIDSVKVKESSGYKRLDDAGLLALKSWQCNAAMRDGEAVRATALQPFDFILN